MQTLKASERVKAIIDLSKFVLPTLKATEMSLSNETKFQAIEIELKWIDFSYPKNLWKSLIKFGIRMVKMPIKANTKKRIKYIVFTILYSSKKT